MWCKSGGAPTLHPNIMLPVFVLVLNEKPNYTKAIKIISFHQQAGRLQCVCMQICLCGGEKEGDCWRTIREHLRLDILTVWASCAAAGTKKRKRLY